MPNDLDTIFQGLGNNPALPAWDDVRADFAAAMPNENIYTLQRRYEGARIQGEARQQFANYDESWPEYLSRRALPFASSLLNFKLGAEYTAAKQRIASGEGRSDRSSWSDWLTRIASPATMLTGGLTRARNDYELVAEYERMQQIDEQRSTAQHIGSSLAGLPAVAGEAYLGGLALRGLGIGAQAAGTAAAGEAVLTSRGLAGFFSGAGARAAGGWAARLAAQTAVMPSMWLVPAAQRAASRAGEGEMNQQWASPSNLVPAFLLGMTQTAVLGSLGSFANGIYGSGVKDVAARLAVRAGTGMAEQQAIDVITSAASEVLPKAWKLSTGYGLLGDALSGDWGKMWKHAAVQAATFAAFSALHEVQSGPPERQVMEGAAGRMEALGIGQEQSQGFLGKIVDVLRDFHKSGIGREQAGEQINRVFDGFIHEMELEPRMTREKAQAFAQEAFKDQPILKGLAEQIANTMPVQLGPEVPPGYIPPRSFIPQGAESPRFTPPNPEQGAVRLSAPIRPSENVARDFYEQQRMQLVRSGRTPATADLIARKRVIGRWPELAEWVREGGVVGIPGDPRQQQQAAPAQRPEAAATEQAQTPPQPPPEPPTGGAPAKRQPKKPGGPGEPIAPEEPAAAPAQPAESAKPEPKTLEEKAHAAGANTESIKKRIKDEKMSVAQVDAKWNSDSAAAQFAREFVRQWNPETQRVATEATPQELHRARIEEIMRAQNFTNQEKAVVRGALEGKTQKKIGEDLGTSDKYVGELEAKIEKRWQQQPGWLRNIKANWSGVESAGIPNELYREGGQAAPTSENLMSKGGAKETGPGQFEMAAKQDALFGGTPVYVADRVRGSNTAKAVALLHERGVMMQKMAAGDPVIRLEEQFHIWSVGHNFEANPAKLPGEVAEGLRQFYNPGAALNPRSMLEGVARWFLRRSLGELNNLTPAQEAAAKYAENFIKEKGFTKKADQIAEMYGQFKEKTPVAQAAGLFSATGKPVEQEQRSFWQRASDAWQDNVTDNLAVLKRAGMDRAHMLYGQLMGKDKATAQRWSQEGVGGIKDGKWTIFGPSEKKMSETLLPQDMAAVGGESLKYFEKGVSNAEIYAAAKHAIKEKGRGRDIVSPEQLKYLQAAMEQYKKDPEFVKRADPFAYELSKGFNATIKVLASPDIHFISVAKGDQMISDKPDYISFRRVKDNNVGKAGFLKGRTGSGEQIVSPLLSYKMRLQETASLMMEQVRRNSVADALLLQPDMAKWGLAFKAEMTPEGKARVGEVAQRLGISEADAVRMLSEYGEHAGAYFDVQPWSSDPSKNTWYWRGKDGELVNFRIKDKALYELISGVQGDANPVAQMFRAAGKLGFDTPWGRVDPISAVSSAVRTGATALSLAFNIKNSIAPAKDPLTFIANSINPKSIVELPGMLRRVYMAEAALAMGKIPEDVLFNFYVREHGRDQHMFSAERNLPEFITSKADVVRKILNVAGAGELAPRILEVKNRLAERGWSEERLISETKKAEEAAKQGKEYVDPVPWDIVQEVMHYGNEVTVPFNRQGIVTREISKIVPFFGPAVAGSSKFIRNWQTNAAGASIALGGYLAARLAYWAAFHDEDWYKEMSAYDRFRNFVVPIPGLGLRRLPGPHGLEVPAGAVLITSLDAASRNNPDFAGMVEQSLSASLPPGIERVAGSAAQGDVVGVGANAVGAATGPVGQTAVDLARNRGFTGSPIVPRREEHLPQSQQLTQYQMPYAAQQLLGGRSPTSLDQEGITRALGVNPVPEVQNLHRSVDSVFERLHELEGPRTVARRAGTRFDDEREYQVMNGAATQIRQLSQRVQGMLPSGRQAEAPSAEEQTRLKARMVEIARRALERAR